jgi:hypothetical protein
MFELWSKLTWDYVSVDSQFEAEEPIRDIKNGPGKARHPEKNLRVCQCRNRVKAAYLVLLTTTYVFGMICIVFFVAAHMDMMNNHQGIRRGMVPCVDPKQLQLTVKRKERTESPGLYTRIQGRS